MTSILIQEKREQRVGAIVAKRQSVAKKLNNIRQVFNSLKATIEVMEERRTEIYHSTDNETIRYRLSTIDLPGLRQRVEIEEKNVARYYSRFARKTLNIGAVGLARQGKSQLLRSLSGLDDSAIPAGPFGHCTGTRSTIIHSPLVEPHGEIEFYTKNEFVKEVIAPYYSELLDSVQQPTTLEEFEHQPLPPLPAEKQQSLSAKIKYAQLELYKNQLGNYKPLLSRTSPRYVPINNVREYVAQEDTSGKRIFYNYLAVREARVVCTFPHDNVGDLAFVDIPGLGDTGIVAENWLGNTLNNDVDIILFVKKPSALGEVWKPQEVDLYDTLRSLLPELDLERWSFLVMNRVRSSSPNEDNVRNCERLIREKSEQMKFAGEVIADCSDSEEVSEIILQEVLDYLTQNIEKIDQVYINSLYDRLRVLHGQIKTEAQKAKEALGVVSESTPFSFNSFNRLFKDVVKKVYSGFEQLTKDLRDKREIPDAVFQDYVARAQENAYADSGIPSLEEIEDTRNLLGGYKSACEYYLNYNRTHLTRHFESLEEGLSKSVESVKIQLADVLKNEFQGRLNQLSAATGTAFFKDVVKLLGEQYPALHPAFEMLIDFQLSYQGFFYYRLRRHLDYLAPDTGIVELSVKPSAKEIHDLLTAMHKIVLENLKGELIHWPIEINHAIFATIEQFVDKVLRSENAIDEWQSFYIENRAKVWPETFQELSVNNGLRWQWIEVTERLGTINKSILTFEN
ncbi:hypothetical protein [Larkinella rosea]|uniref:Dynamin family protein n=1 Tax=Larkinella rosea TaxID=2025312 RepID=A0A3P1C348_9BACT|nr:hypothetical protein [Larkinella rosea]RRB07727.1 hypothetical protein EHT25_08120 [Larkinella rosea]